MPRKQAKIPAVEHIDDSLFFAKMTRHPLRNRVMVLLFGEDGPQPRGDSQPDFGWSSMVAAALRLS